MLGILSGKEGGRFPHYQAISAFLSGVLFEGRQIIFQNIKSKPIRNLLGILFSLIIFPFYLIGILTVYSYCQWSWRIYGTFKGTWIIKKYRPSLLYSTGGTSQSHGVDFFLKILDREPWLGEVHDPLKYDKEPQKE